METKFILHGGNASHENAENDLFFKEILKNTSENPKILLVCFSKRDNEASESAIKDKKQFEKNKGNKNPYFELADENNFAEQIKKSDIIYLRGGKTSKLLATLNKYSSLKELLTGKIVAGESAGAYVLSKCFYSKSEKGLFNGLGFVPVKTICHYIGENAEKLDDCSKNIEKLLLKDYQYKVFLI